MNVRAILMASCAALVAAPGVAMAADDDGTVAEMVVTAQKRAEKLIEVPLSVQSLSGEAVERSGAAKVSDLTKLIPGASVVSSTTPGFETVQIRGVSSGSIVPYLEQNRATICTQCAYLHKSICPCPMDYLAALLVQAVETVDQRNIAERRTLRDDRVDPIEDQRPRHDAPRRHLMQHPGGRDPALGGVEDKDAVSVALTEQLMAWA